MREKPLGRMTLRRNAPGDGQKPRIRLWTLPDPPENSTAAKLLKHYERVFTNVDALDAKKAELKANEALTEIGKQRAALDFGFSSIMPDVLRARRAISKASQEAATKRSKLQQPASDPQDLAGALRRQEIRGIMRGLDDTGRDLFLRKNGLLTGLNPEIRQALIEMPPTLSGISQSKHDQFMNEAAAALNGPALAEIHELERAIEITESAITEGSKDLQRSAIEVDAGFADLDRFEARAKEAAALEEPVWLKTFNENGIDVLRFHDWDEKTQSGGWRIPTSSQIESGLIAESHDQYLRLKTAPPVGAFGTGAEGRAARAQYVNEHGIDSYLDRHEAA